MLLQLSSAGNSPAVGFEPILAVVQRKHASDGSGGFEMDLHTTQNPNLRERFITAH
jgi:hypothetical protein